jgi:hypothetical protein
MQQATVPGPMGSAAPGMMPGMVPGVMPGMMPGMPQHQQHMPQQQHMPPTMQQMLPGLHNQAFGQQQGCGMNMGMGSMGMGMGMGMNQQHQQATTSQEQPNLLGFRIKYMFEAGGLSLRFSTRDSILVCPSVTWAVLAKLDVFGCDVGGLPGNGFAFVVATQCRPPHS